MRKPDFRLCINKSADHAVTAKLISAFVFATQIVWRPGNGGDRI